MAEIENLKIGNGGTLHIVGNEDIVANAWQAGKTYVKNKSYVIREHRLYVCNVTHTSVEPFDATKWTEITIGDAIGNNIGDLSSLTTTNKSSLVGAVNEVNSGKADKTALTWTLLGETTGTAEQNLPATWNELQVYGMFGGNAQYGFVAHTIYAHIGSNPSRYIQGGADKEGGTDHHIAIWHIESGKIGLNFWRYNNTDYTSTAKLIVYYR